MNFNHLKDKLSTRKTSVCYTKILDERPLTYLKKNAKLYLDGAGLTNNYQNKKDDTSVNYFTKTAYRRPLLPNAESVEKINQSKFSKSSHPICCVKCSRFWPGFKNQDS